MGTLYVLNKNYVIQWLSKEQNIQSFFPQDPIRHFVCLLEILVKYIPGYYKPW